MSNSDSGAGFLSVLLWFGFMVLLICRGCMATPDQAKQHAEDIGFTEVEVTDHHWFFVSFRGCGTDAAMFRFKAKNINGKNVKLNACVGWPFKGVTIRGN